MTNLSEASIARELLTSQPECQTLRPLPGLTPVCEPGCVHERLQVKRATVYALLDIGVYLDTIAAELHDIAKSQ